MSNESTPHELRQQAERFRNLAAVAERQALAIELGDLPANIRASALGLARRIYDRCGPSVGEDVRELVALLDHAPEDPTQELSELEEEEYRG
jgi:hypothetical protein